MALSLSSNVIRDGKLAFHLLLLFVTFSAKISLPAAYAQQTIIAQPLWGIVQEAMSLSNRVYLFKSTDSFAENEFYFENEAKTDAVAVGVYDDRCIVAFRGTKVLNTTENDFCFLPNFAQDGLTDILQNIGAFQRLNIESKTDISKKCTAAKKYYEAYYSTAAQHEKVIDLQCSGKMLYMTGHSQGAALAQLAAVRYEMQQPQVISFAPAPAFFGECTLVPDENVLNFVNTETDGGFWEMVTGLNLEFRTPVQYDVIPFVDVVLKKIIPYPGFVIWSFLPEAVQETLLNPPDPDDLVSLVGSYKGSFVILNPNEKLPNNEQLSAAYVNRREQILDVGTSSIGLDTIDFEEVIDFCNPSFGERIASAHNPDSYEKKISALYQQNSYQLNPTGFGSFTYCNPGSEFLCEDECIATAICSSGALGEPCVQNEFCDSGHCVSRLDGFRCAVRGNFFSGIVGNIFRFFFG